MPDPSFAVIFDLDGCLVDSEPTCLTTLADMLATAGIKAVTWQDLRDEFMGISLTQICRIMSQRHDCPLPGDFVARFDDRVCDAFTRSLALMPGAADALQALSAMGVPLAIATGSSVRRMQLATRTTGIAPYFTNTSCSADQVVNGKPAPDLFLFAAERMAVDPASCIVIDDSPNGILGARRAGMTAFGFTGGSHLAGAEARQAARLQEAGATGVLGQMADLIPALRMAEPR